MKKKRLYTLSIYNKLMEKRKQDIENQKAENLRRYKKMQLRLIEEKKNRDKINLKSQIRQEKYEEAAKNMKSVREQFYYEKSQSQADLFLKNQENKDKMRDDLIQKYNKLEKEMEEKEKIRQKKHQKKLYDIMIKQEDEYLKQYEKKQNIDKIGRINQYKSEKRNEEILKKEKKMEEFKKKKNELIQNKSKQADKYEKEKEKLINDFEKNFRNKEHFDTNQLIDSLFPQSGQLSENDTKLKQKIEKLIQEMNKTDPSKLNENNISSSMTNNRMEENSSEK